MNTLFPDVPYIFPNDLENLIFQNFSPQELTQKTSIVCKKWKKCSDAGVVWESLFFKYFEVDSFDFPSWKLKFQEGYECLNIVDQLFEDQMNDKMDCGSHEFRMVCDWIDLKIREFRWVKSCSNSEIIPIFLRFKWIKDRFCYPQGIPITNNVHYSLSLFTKENFDAILSEDNRRTNNDEKVSWCIPQLGKEKVIARINNIEKLLNNRLNSFGESVFEYNKNKLLKIKSAPNSFYIIDFDLNCKINKISKTNHYVTSDCEDSYNLIYNDANVLNNSGHALRNARNRRIIYVVMDYSIKLLRKNQLF